MHKPGLGKWTSLLTMLIRLLIFNSLINTIVSKLSLFFQEHFDILMGQMANAYLGWTSSCLILDTVNIYWCKTCCKWNLANQDGWLFSVSSKCKMCNIYKLPTPNHVEEEASDYSLTLGWLHCLPKQFSSIEAFF
jgi:hypothetical protein